MGVDLAVGPGRCRSLRVGRHGGTRDRAGGGPFPEFARMRAIAVNGKWSPGSDLNRRPPLYESGAPLPQLTMQSRVTRFPRSLGVELGVQFLGPASPATAALHSRLVDAAPSWRARAHGARLPRVARMVALAHHWRGLIRSGAVKDQAALSALVGASRARITQVMGLLYLALDIQEEVLFLPAGRVGGERIQHRDLLDIAATPSWSGQRTSWTRFSTQGPAA